jgi:hypothetical protein
MAKVETQTRRCQKLRQLRLAHVSAQNRKISYASSFFSIIEYGIGRYRHGGARRRSGCRRNKTSLIPVRVSAAADPAFPFILFFRLRPGDSWRRAAGDIYA